MHQRSAVIYRYDGSFEGLLCCVYEAFYAKDDISAIQDETGPLQDSLFGCKQIDSDPQKADRVYRSIREKISQRAQELFMLGFLTCAADKELMLLQFLRLGYRVGAKVTGMLAEDPVCRLWKAVRYLTNEAHKYKGFLRFSEMDGALYAQIAPKNHVLPLLRDHFVDRYRSEAFVIYDENRRLALIYQKGQDVIAPVAQWEPPRPDADEQKYRQAWKMLYETVAIKERMNPVCRRGHMPMRYWNRMTEFTG